MAAAPKDTPNFLTGLGLIPRAALLILRTPRLRRAALVPLGVNVLLYITLITGLIWLLAQWQPQVAWTFWSPMGEWLASAFNMLFGTLKWVAGLPLILVICYVSFNIVGLLIANLFGDRLCARTEQTLDEIPASSPVAETSTEGSLRFMLSLTARQLFWTLWCLPFLLIPIAGALPLMSVAARFGGAGYLDTAASRHPITVAQRRAVLRNYRHAIFGLGLGMELLFLIPFAGLLILPVGIVAGTLLFRQIPWQTLATGKNQNAPGSSRP